MQQISYWLSGRKSPVYLEMYLGTNSRSLGRIDQRYWQRIDGRERENVALGLPFQRPLPPPDSQASGGNDAHPACTGQLNKPQSVDFRFQDAWEAGKEKASSPGAWGQVSDLRLLC